MRYALIPFMGFIICYVPVREYIPFNIPREAPKGSIKILSYNTWAFAEGEMGEDGINPVVKYIKEQNADIVCLQEVGAYWGCGEPVGFSSLSDVCLSGYNLAFGRR